MDEFGHRRNLDHYVELLKTESEPKGRSHLLSLLLEEEDRFGSWSHRADLADDYIAKGKAQVRNQERALARLRPGDPRAAGALRVLDNSRQIVAILEAYRRCLLETPGGF
jgi:hypothetical protein